MSKARPLKNLTADDLRPLWSRLDIPTARMAEALGVSRAALSYKALSLGLPSRKHNNGCRTFVSDKRFTELWNSGLSLKAMHSACGYSKGSQHGVITQRRSRLGLPPRTRSKNTGNHAGWVETISAETYIEMVMAKETAWG